MTDRELICAFLRAHGPSTLGQIARATCIPNHIVSGALVKMAADGRVARHGMTKGPARGGRFEVQVWCAGEAADPAAPARLKPVQVAARAGLALERAWMGAA